MIDFVYVEIVLLLMIAEAKVIVTIDHISFLGIYLTFWSCVNVYFCSHLLTEQQVVID